MDMIIDAIVSLVVHWRVGLTFFLSIVISVALASWLPWFTGAYGLTLVLVSFGGGLMWQASAMKADNRTRLDEQAQ